METETIYEQEGAGPLDIMIQAGIAVGILIVIIVIMNVVALQTYSVSKTQLDTITDGNGMGFKASAFDAMGSAFDAFGTLGNFIPIVVIVVVAAIVLALLGGVGRTSTGGGQGF